MASTIRKSRYFDTVEDLSLTHDQELQLIALLPLITRICNKFNNHRCCTGILSVDDLIQMASVMVVKILKNTKRLSQIRDFESYIKRVVSWSCYNQLTCNKVRGDSLTHLDIDDLELHYTPNIEDNIYANELLDKLPSPLQRVILKNKYGMDYCELGIKSTTIATEKYRAILALQETLLWDQN